jgi:hypothetical protein
MGPAATFALGLVAGLILFFAMAITGVIAVNGVNNPGVGPAQASAAAGGTAGAPLVEEGSASLHTLDLDGDGKVSLGEAAGHAGIVTRFDRADRNRDGKLTQREFDRLAKLPPPKTPKPKSMQKTIRRDAATAAAAGG